MRGLKIRVIGQGGITTHPVIVLGTPLSREPVIVPAHGVKHLFAPHALVPGEAIGVGIGKHVSYVQRSRGRRWGSVDGEDFRALRFAVKRIDLLLFPGLPPTLFEAIYAYSLRYLGGG